MAEKEGRVDVSHSDSITTIEFSHPKGNSLPSRLLRDLENAVKESSRNDSCRVILLRSAGETVFCGGASFQELAALQNAEEAKEFFTGFARVMTAMLESPVPVLTRVQGKAVGGGVGLIAASDYVVASSTASVRLSELELGIGPFVIGPIVERRVGTSRFRSMAIGANWRSADWCSASGLFDEVVEPALSLEQEMRRIAEKFASYSSEAFRAFKQLSEVESSYLSQLSFERAEMTAKLVMSSPVQKDLKALAGG